MKYEVFVSINITPAKDADGWPLPGMLNYSQKFTLSGDRFTDLGPKIDAVYDAIALVADEEKPE